MLAWRVMADQITVAAVTAMLSRVAVRQPGTVEEGIERCRHAQVRCQEAGRGQGLEVADFGAYAKVTDSMPRG